MKLDPIDWIAFATVPWAIVSVVLCLVSGSLPQDASQAFAPWVIGFVGVGGIALMGALLGALIEEAHKRN